MKFWKYLGGKWYSPTSSWLDHPAGNWKIKIKSVKNKTNDHKNTNIKIDEKYLYDIDTLSLDENYKEQRKRGFESKIKIFMIWKDWKVWTVYMITK